ncbi:MAG: hypothetical protein WCX48_06510 [Bacteroidales bacterium]
MTTVIINDPKILFIPKWVGSYIRYLKIKLINREFTISSRMNEKEL